MSIVAINGGRIGFGDVVLVDGINAIIHPGQRIGFVGPNGSGKTTLLRIIAREMSLDRGRLDMKRSARVGFLKQIYAESNSSSARTLFEEMEEATAEIDELSARIDELTTILAGPGLENETKRTLVGKLGSLQHRFETLGGYERELEIKRVLMGVGFTEDQFSQPVSTMSGGQKQKVGLARLLLERPDLFLLDEPNNHLDLEGRRFLENFLCKAPCAVLAVSHDRYFLNRVAQYVWELDQEKLFTYRGNYDAFRIQRLDRIERQRAEYEAQQEYIKRTEEYIRRNIAGQNTRQARGRRKHLARLKRIEAVGDARTLKFDLDGAARTGEEVLRADLLSHRFGDGEWLFNDLSFSISRGDKVGIIGPNGCGKSTLLNILARTMKPVKGRISFGANVHFTHLSQESLDLSPDLTVMDEFRKAAPALDNPALRGELARYLFCGDDVFKLAGELSGGEKRRLALAKLLYSRPNLLFLDEPTNHFDIPSFEMIEAALADFAGTVLLVSHDRTLLDAVANRIFVFTPDGILDCEGNYSDYLRARSGEETATKIEAIEGADVYSEGETARAIKVENDRSRAGAIEQRAPLESDENPREKPGRKSRRSPELEREKLAEKLEVKLDEIEREIEEWETKYAETASELSVPEVASDRDRITEIADVMAECERKLSALYENLESLIEKFEEHS